jgi:uncharacterized Fe-S cluster protein YjdI
MTATKSYVHGDLTVVWTQDRCIHSANCVSGLPSVFDPAKRPWIDLSGADRAAVIAQVERCPTKALAWLQTADQPAVPVATSEPPPPLSTHVDVTSNGPLIVRGPHSVTTPDGKTAERQGPAAYCRCGASARKPFCDGAHARVGFKG